MNRFKVVLAGFSTAIVLAGSMALAQDAGASMPSGDTSAQDKKFLMDASEGGLFEITASRIALKKTKDPEIRAFAQKMVDHHTMLSNDLLPFDKTMMVTPATRLKPEHAEEASRLKSMGGDKFNVEYVKAMDAAHHKDRGDFRNERDTTSNSDLKATVAKGYDLIKEHTDAIDAIATRLNLPVPTNSDPISAPSM